MKNWSWKLGLCILVPNQISVLGDIEKKSFIALLGKGKHSGHLPQKMMCPNLGGFDEELYSNGSRWVGLLTRLGCVQALAPLILPQMVLWLLLTWLALCPLECREDHGGWSLPTRNWGQNVFHTQESQRVFPFRIIALVTITDFILWIVSSTLKTFLHNIMPFFFLLFVSFPLLVFRFIFFSVKIPFFIKTSISCQILECFILCSESFLHCCVFLAHCHMSINRCSKIVWETCSQLSGQSPWLLSPLRKCVSK